MMTVGQIGFHPFYLALAILLLPGFSYSQTKATPFQLSWQVPAECGNQEDVVQRTFALLDNPAPEHSNDAPEISGAILAEAGKWRVRVNMSCADTKYERTLLVNTCHGAIEVAVLLSAMAINPGKVMNTDDADLRLQMENVIAAAQTENALNQTETDLGGNPDVTSDAADSTESGTFGAIPGEQDNTQKDNREPAPLSTKENLQENPSESHSESHNNRQNRQLQTSDEKKGASQRRGILGGVAFLLNSNLHPGMRPGIAGMAGAYRHYWRLTLRCDYLPTATEHLNVAGANAAANTNARWSSVSISGTVSAGHVYHTRVMAIGWSLGARVIGIHAATDNMPVTMAQWVWLCAGDVSGHIEWRVQKYIGVWLSPSVSILFSRPKFIVEGAGELHQPDRLVWSAAIGVFFVWGNGK
ncbi:MAG: hypothetical protein JXX14_11930 [Deltaproteobacteria bacterium]|nr:hypothetical protein [Deltaproteobacteria bacterium]